MPIREWSGIHTIECRIEEKRLYLRAGLIGDTPHLTNRDKLSCRINYETEKLIGTTYDYEDITVDNIMARDFDADTRLLKPEVAPSDQGHVFTVHFPSSDGECQLHDTPEMGASLICENWSKRWKSSD